MKRAAAMIVLSSTALVAGEAPAAPAAAAAALSAAAPMVVTASSAVRLWVDQIGYRTSGRKLAIVASDAALPDGLQIELRDAHTNAVVWAQKDHAGSYVPSNGGQKDRDSNDFVAQLDFSSCKAPGRYYLVLLGAEPMRSYQFNIAEHPHREAGLAAWKAFWYSRADGEKLEKYGGAWNHGKAFLGPNQATEAKVYQWAGGRWPDSVGKEIIDPKPYDVHGGWWDAGDLNKYTSNTTDTQNMMLMTYEIAKAAAGDKGGPQDKELNIPESGNGIPDVLDEIRCGTEFLIRDHDGTGAAFGRVHQESGSPPETVTAAVQLTSPSSETTMMRAAALSYAAAVWRDSKLDNAFAASCQTEALRSWNLVKEKPHPWPVDPKDPKKVKSTGEMGAGNDDFHRHRALAAGFLFRLTGSKEYDDVVHEECGKMGWAQGKGFDPDGEGMLRPLMWSYLHTKGADAMLAANIKQAILATADTALGWTGAHRAYAMAMRGYWWGSNSSIGNTGGILVMAARLSDSPDKKKDYLEGAEEYVHYLYGRNPRGECYFSNMKSFGAEHSAMVMFHGWVGNINSKTGGKYIGEGEGKIGPFPGYVIGGPNGSMKRLVEDPDLDWRKSPWEFTESDIGYQAPCCLLLSPFTWPQ